MGPINEVQNIRYRWFIIINLPNNHPSHYLPFSLSDTIKLETSHQSSESSITLNNITIDFGKMLYNSLPITREPMTQAAKLVLSRPRYNSFPFKQLQPYEYTELSKYRLLFYNTLFNDNPIDSHDSFMLSFTNHISLFTEDLIAFLTKDFTAHLTSQHNVSPLGQKLTFDTIKTIIIKDFSTMPSLNGYAEYYLNEMTIDNYKETIEEILSEEGDLYTMINYPEKNISICMYYLLVMYTMKTRVNSKEITVVYKEIEKEQIDMFNTFKPGNLLLSNEFISVSKHQNLFKKKNRCEISIETPLNKYEHLSYKCFDISTHSLYINEGECLIQPNSIMEVNGIDIDYEENVLIVKLTLKTNFFADFIPYRLNEEMKMKLGICDKPGLDIKENYPMITLENIVALSFSSNEQITPNMNYIGCMKNLTSLDLSNAGIKDNDLIALTPYISNLSFLQYLNLSQNGLTFKGITDLVETFKILPMLHYLNLNQNELGDKGIMELSKGLHLLGNLHTLNLVYNKIKYHGICALGKKLAYLTKLHVLNLSSNFIFCEEMDDLIACFDYMPQLNYLNLSNNQVLSEGLMSISGKLNHLKHLQHINLSENCIKPDGFITFINRISQCPNMLSLIFYGNQIGAMGIKALVDNLPHLPNLRALNIGFNLLTDDELVLIAREMHHIPDIQIMNFRENSIGQRGILEFTSNLYKIPKLTHVDFGWNQINYEALESFLSQAKCIPNIISMNYESNPIRPACLKTFLHELKGIDPSWVLQKGEFLRLNSQKRTEELMMKYVESERSSVTEELKLHYDLNELNYLNKYINLKKLDLSKQKIGVEGIKTLKIHIAKLNKLSIIDLRCNELGDEGMKQFCYDLKQLPNLLYLNLRENNIGIEGIKALSSSYKSINSLQSLNLSWNQISDEGMQYLSQCDFSNLESLKLRENNINAEGIGYFVQQFDTLTKLKHLDLCWNTIGSNGLDLFSTQMQKLTQLKTLNLGRNTIGNEGIALFVMKLKECYHVESLSLFNNNINDTAAANFLTYFDDSATINYCDMSQNPLSEEIKQKFRDVANDKQINIEV